MIRPLLNRTLVRDLHRDSVATVERVCQKDLPSQHRDAIEHLIAVELLRITPRFWSGAVLSVSFACNEFDHCDATILCLDGFPAYASVSAKLRERIHRLAGFVEIHGPPLTTNVLIGIAWHSSRTWIYTSKYFTRRTGYLGPPSPKPYGHRRDP